MEPSPGNSRSGRTCCYLSQCPLLKHHPVSPDSVAVGEGRAESGDRVPPPQKRWQLEECVCRRRRQPNCWETGQLFRTAAFWKIGGTVAGKDEEHSGVKHSGTLIHPLGWGMLVLL
ncbi:hypothetical protein AAFF_G00116140 [Aldrovandia affinis]|uniref:Uncharacterized protein n=1 Tax=Aldrovandia affinis TaxID=143900 RepID=A0AAD7WXK5_9TELE|nr:hypothetical protein AAFF_G00116140 [Aldrovandia affinis]